MIRIEGVETELSPELAEKFHQIAKETAQKVVDESKPGLISSLINWKTGLICMGVLCVGTKLAYPRYIANEQRKVQEELRANLVQVEASVGEQTAKIKTQFDTNNQKIENASVRIDNIGATEENRIKTFNIAFKKMADERQNRNEKFTSAINKLTNEIQKGTISHQQACEELKKIDGQIGHLETVLNVQNKSGRQIKHRIRTGQKLTRDITKNHKMLDKTQNETLSSVSKLERRQKLSHKNSLPAIKSSQTLSENSLD
ncbi:hypothetical protein HYX58_03690 [Candidatus Dependentiae bacterium]|nr:hypothetical protein [Candidatus Dependentiae bacterium]